MDEINQGGLAPKPASNQLSELQLFKGSASNRSIASSENPEAQIQTVLHLKRPA